MISIDDQLHVFHVCFQETPSASLLSLSSRARRKRRETPGGSSLSDQGKDSLTFRTNNLVEANGSNGSTWFYYVPPLEEIPFQGGNVWHRALFGDDWSLRHCEGRI